MTMRTHEIEVHAGSGNVYADLGFPHAAAMLRKAKLDARGRKVPEKSHASKKRLSAFALNRLK